MSLSRPLNLEPARFAELGYCVFRGLLDDELLAPCQDSLREMLEALPAGRRPETLVEPQVRSVDWRRWLELGRHPKLLEAVTACIHTSEILLLSSHLLVKPPRDGVAVCWHQDNTYWPSVEGTDVLTAWIAFDQTDLENACMKFIPRSHDGHPELQTRPTEGRDLLGVEVEVDADMAASAVAVELGVGDVSLHDSFIIHGSDPNPSSRRRAGYALRYCDATTVAVDLERHGKPVYYVSGGEEPIPGWRDIRPGRPLPDDPGEHRSRRFDDVR